MKNVNHRNRDGKPFCRDGQQHYRAIRNDYSEIKGTARGKLEFITDVKNLARECDEDCCSGTKDIGGYKWRIKLGKPGPNVCVYLVCEHRPNDLLCAADVTVSLIGKKEYCRKCHYECSGGNLCSEFKCVFPIKYKYVMDRSHGLVDSNGNILIRAEIYETCYEHPDGFTDAARNKKINVVKLAEEALQKIGTSIQNIKNMIDRDVFASLDAHDGDDHNCVESLNKIAASLKEIENNFASYTDFGPEGESDGKSNGYKGSSDTQGFYSSSEKQKIVAEVENGTISYTTNIDAWLLPLMESSKNLRIAGAEWCLVLEERLDGLSARIHCKHLLSGSSYEVTYCITFRHSLSENLVKKGFAVFDKSTNYTDYIPLIEMYEILSFCGGRIDCLGTILFEVDLSVMRFVTTSA